MLEVLDEALLDHFFLVRSHYITCFHAAIEQALDRTGRKAGRVLVEASVRLDTEDSGLGHLVDLVEVDHEGGTQLIHVVHRSVAPWDDVSYDVGDATTLLVKEIVWFAVKVLVHPPDPACAEAWFAHWHSNRSEVGKPFSGRVHFMDTEASDRFMAVTIDLGSAPVQALCDLIDRCVDAGARQIVIGSDDHALAGTSAA